MTSEKKNMPEKIQVEDILKLLDDEFGALAKRFQFHNIPLNQARDWKDKNVAMPGVYVFWTRDYGIIRVGRSYDNTRKRALTHLPANTGGMVSMLKGDDSDRLLLFNSDVKENRHWIAALEIYFERVLIPKVPPGRR
ncbi:MAG: hypothetical protein HOL70_10545 [Candidatus Marinimicrobia bacterium]|nr:hypothetical protein [Candidatus Neomarinimicrobiota bacterium]